MKNSKTIIVALFALLTFTTFSCKEDDKDDPKPVDVREQAVGKYKGTWETLLLADFETEIFDEQNITFKVSKNKDNNASIDITFEGNVIKGVKVAEASNGFSFDIETQTIEDIDEDGEKEEVEGEEFFELGGTKYHGMFNSKTKEFMFGLSSMLFIDLDGDNVPELTPVFFGITGKKQ